MDLGTVILDRGMLGEAELEDARREAASSGERLDRVLVRSGRLRRGQVLEALAAHFHMPVADLPSLSVEPAVLGLVPARFVFGRRCVPVAREGSRLTIATADPFDLSPADELRLLTGLSIEPVLADEEDLHAFIRANYGVGGDTLDAMAADLPEAARQANTDELEAAQEASVVKLVNDILTEAVAERATDVHVEPYEHDLIVRYRIDGVLQRANVASTITRFGPAIISRLKIMANLNIAEKRKPQDGRITFRARVPGKPPEETDLRVSTIPMLFGEGVVLRILSKSAVLMSLDQLGMPQGVLKNWADLINRPHGILLVTGPTGSGKSTTLYASLNRIVSDEIKAITVEDPVEYHVKGVNQIQVNPIVGLDFAAGLRAILRHDPDVVMIGEIRDKETAETAIQASLTGHLVFSTLHTNDASGATTRLLDMGVEPFLVSSSVEGILAQRLVRRVCKDCAAAHHPQAGELPADFTMPDGATLLHAQGCRNCRNTGYRGRVGVYELLRVSEHVREMVMQRANARAIAQHARGEGNLASLREDGYAKASAGLTTLAEVASALAG
jgi:type II secretory ATPase GspE/PulE/Tfp pilus assembly ATPase PilB-like protein